MKFAVLPLLAVCFFATTAFAVETQPANPASVVEKYRDIPKGVVLEGTAEGFEALNSVTFDKDKNEFTINEKYTYKNPLTKKEFAQVLKAIVEDDLMGVTLLEGKTKTYGKISTTSTVVNAMVDSDKLLGGIIYGIDFLLGGVKLPGDFKPKKAGDRKIPVVAFSSLSGYVFEKHGTEYIRASCKLDITLIPLAEKKAAGGGHLPDEELAKQYVMEEADRDNIDYLRSHQSDFFKMAEFSKSVAAGEAAAFSRLIRDSKIDSEALLKTIK